MLARLLHPYREAYRGLPREVWILGLAVLVNRIGSMVSPFLLLYLTTQLRFPASSAGLLIALMGGAGILGTLLGGWMVDRTNPGAVQVGSLLATGVCLYTLGQARTVLGLGVSLFFLGLVTELFRPANAAAISQFSSPQTRSRAFALRRLGVNLG